MIAAILDMFSSDIILLLKQQAYYFSVLFIPSLAVSYLLRHRSPKLLLCLWSLVLLRLVLPPDLASPLSVREFFETLLPATKTVADFEPLSELTPDNTSRAVITALPILVTWNTLFAFLWLSISGALLLRYGLQRRYFRRLIARGDHRVPAPLSKLLNHWRCHYGIRREVQLVITAETVSPFTVGIRCPRVVLPRTLLEQLDQEQLGAILAHELAHVKRFDDAWIHLQHFLQCLFFFTPAVWLCNAQINRLRELVADQMALANRQICPRQYGRAMLSVLKLSHSNRSQPVAGFVNARHFYSTRFQALGNPRRRTFKEMGLELLLILATLLFVLPMAPTNQSIQAERQQMFALSDTMVPAVPLQFGQPLEEGSFSYAYGVRQTYFGIWPQEDLHMGVDINAPLGSAVNAIAPGEVGIASEDPREGFSYLSVTYVVIRHPGGFRSLVGPLRDLQVQAGERVVAGQTLGFLSRSISPSNPQTHLHLEVSRDGIRIDPAKVIDLTRYTAAYQKARQHLD